MPTIQCFEEIDAWQTARVLTRRLYALSNEGLFSRDFGLRDQMRRASVSIMSNIAEGFESRTKRLFIFRELFDLSDKCSRQISRFITYLETQAV